MGSVCQDEAGAKFGGFLRGSFLFGKRFGASIFECKAPLGERAGSAVRDFGAAACAEIHDGLIGVARIAAGCDGVCGIFEHFSRHAAREVACDAEKPCEYALGISVDGCNVLVKGKGRNRASGVFADAANFLEISDILGEFAAELIDDDLRALVKKTRTTVIAQTRPELQDFGNICVCKPCSM